MTRKLERDLETEGVIQQDVQRVLSESPHHFPCVCVCVTRNRDRETGSNMVERLPGPRVAQLGNQVVKKSCPT